MYKLLLFLIMIIVWYAFVVIQMPDVWNYFWENLWMKHVNKIIIDLKNFREEPEKWFPDSPELQNIYSWAIDLKDDIVDWLNYTKDKIDSTRVYLSGANDAIDSIKDWYEDVSEFISWATDKIDEAKDLIDTIKDITNTWVTNTWITNTWVTN
jgi:hypothetical protein